MSPLTSPQLTTVWNSSSKNRRCASGALAATVAMVLVGAASPARAGAVLEPLATPTISDLSASAMGIDKFGSPADSAVDPQLIRVAELPSGDSGGSDEGNAGGKGGGGEKKSDDNKEHRDDTGKFDQDSSNKQYNDKDDRDPKGAANEPYGDNKKLGQKGDSDEHNDDENKKGRKDGEYEHFGDNKMRGPKGGYDDDHDDKNKKGRKDGEYEHFGDNKKWGPRGDYKEHDDNNHKWSHKDGEKGHYGKKDKWGSKDRYCEKEPPKKDPPRATEQKFSDCSLDYHDPFLNWTDRVFCVRHPLKKPLVITGFIATEFKKQIIAGNKRAAKASVVSKPKLLKLIRKDDGDGAVPSWVVEFLSPGPN